MTQNTDSAWHYWPTDEEVRRLYRTLISKSWESPQDLVHQRAWNLVSAAWGVDVGMNGCGPVLRSLRRLPSNDSSGGEQS